jgi:subtilisin family serine protease
MQLMFENTAMLLMYKLLLFINLFTPLKSSEHLYTFSIENRIKIAIIDTGINIAPEYLCETGHKDFTNTNLSDNALHGSIIAAIIAKSMDIKRHCIVNIKWWHNNINFTTRYSEVFRVATNSGAKLINLSAYGRHFDELEQIAIEEALQNGVIVVIAAGNESKNLSKQCVGYPACYNIKHENFIVVGNTAKSSNKGGPVNRIEAASITVDGVIYRGTSFSAALWSRHLVEKKL